MDVEPMTSLKGKVDLGDIDSDHDKLNLSLNDSDGYCSKTSDVDNSSDFNGTYKDEHLPHEHDSQAMFINDKDGLNESDYDSYDELDKGISKEHNVDDFCVELSKKETNNTSQEYKNTSTNRFTSEMPPNANICGGFEAHYRKRKRHDSEPHESILPNELTMKSKSRYRSHAGFIEEQQRLHYLRKKSELNNLHNHVYTNLYENSLNTNEIDDNQHSLRRMRTIADLPESVKLSSKNLHRASVFGGDQRINTLYRNNTLDENKYVEDLSAEFKIKINQAIENVINEFMKGYIEYNKIILTQLNKERELKHNITSNSSTHCANPIFWNDGDVIGKSHDNSIRNIVDSLNHNRIHHPIPAYPPLHFYRYFPTSLPSLIPQPQPILHQQVPDPMASPEPEQTEALSLVISTPKKKRTKVTDTRLSPRAAKALLHDGYDPSLHEITDGSMSEICSVNPLISNCLPTSQSDSQHVFEHSEYVRVIKNNSPLIDVNSKNKQQFHMEHGSPESANVTSSDNARLSHRRIHRFDTTNHASTFYHYLSMPCTSTLTPMHLRKAKLMFFYVRYPSSSVLKTYFPDIQFNKNNTAQLVKWFSNFREFFYIQMEKYARQAMAEGISCASQLKVTTDSEVYRVLNLHYNRNNQLDVPEKFRQTVEASLKEFFVAISSGKDSEQPWKKSIYKVIQRLDEKLPDFFLLPNWMELLGET